ncbi:zinc finger protein 830 [Aplochiton taeniatus]
MVSDLKDFFENPVKATCSGSVQNAAGLRLLAGVYDEEDDEEEDDGNAEEKKEVGTLGSLTQKGEPVPSGLPDDFFDSSIPSAPAVSHSGSILKADEPDKIVDKKDNTAESLPEGFFDDPVRDAKVRNVEAPKDQMDKEWDEFQKEIRQVNTKSEAIVAEDDEEGRLERQIDEIDEQIQCYRRIEILRDKQEVVKGKSLKVTLQEHKSIDGSDEEEEDEEELLHLLSRDWRAKGALA